MTEGMRMSSDTGQGMITWDAATLRELKQAYQVARNLNVDQFTMEVDGKGYSFVTDYAKYLIEYLDTRLET